MNAQRLLLGCLMVAGAVALAQQAESFAERRMPPVEAAEQQEGLTAFRQTLAEVIASRNPDALQNIVAPGTQPATPQFRQRWSLGQNPRESALWQHLDKLMEFGGAMNGEDYVIPYFVAQFPEDLDPYQFGLITGENVNVRSRPELGAPVLRQVSHGLVRFIFDTLAPPPTETINGETHPWVKIGLPNGAVGYVWGKYFRSAKDYHAIIRRVDGTWRLAYFGTGNGE